MIRNLTALSLAAAVPSIACAQAFTLSSANATYTNTITTTVGGNSANLDTSPCSTTDHLWGNHWCFSINGSGIGDTFDDVGNGAYQQTPGPAQMLQTITNVASQGLMDALIDDILISTGPHSGQVLSSLTVVNTSATSLDLKLYHFADIDLNSSNFLDYSLPGSGPSRYVIGDDMPCGGCLVFEAMTPADHFECGDWFSPGGAPGAAISAGADLNDTGLPFTGVAPAQDDWCGAFQWNRTLAPGSSTTLNIMFDLPAIGANGTNVNTGLALGGAGGAPTLTSATLPRVGRTFTIDVGNGGAAAAATVLLGFDAAPLQLPALGLQIMIPISGIIAPIPIPLAAGSGSFSINIGCNLTVNGLPLCMQAFVADITSPAGLPLSHSDILISTIGD